MRPFGKLLSGPGKFGRRLVDVFLPPLSPLSGQVVSSPGALEAEHWKQLGFITGTLCDACGTPLPASIIKPVFCGACEASPPRVNRTRSALRYDDASRGLILTFKHSGRTDALPAFVNWMQFAGSDLFTPNALLLPVPLHPIRRLERKFNQAALLAGRLAMQADLQVAPAALRRKRNTPRQGARDGPGRKRNVQGAFEVPEKTRELLAKRSIILIDDVRTSGATLDACARALAPYKPHKIDALTLARIVKARDVTT